ncbi:hypothetical protein HK104_007318, partial [Borealophlyctis nickersoniae]
MGRNPPDPTASVLSTISTNANASATVRKAAAPPVEVVMRTGAMGIHCEAGDQDMMGSAEWQTNFFVLKGARLHRFLNEEQYEEDAQPTSEINIAGCKLENVEEYKDRMASMFRLTTQDGAIYFFECDSDADVMGWMLVLEATSASVVDASRKRLEREIAEMRKRMTALWELQEAGNSTDEDQREIEGLVVELGSKESELKKLKERQDEVAANFRSKTGTVRISSRTDAARPSTPIFTPPQPQQPATQQQPATRADTVRTSRSSSGTIRGRRVFDNLPRELTQPADAEADDFNAPGVYPAVEPSTSTGGAGTAGGTMRGLTGTIRKR